ncbi:hypothetical protein KIW84_015406, partial [Lathyrus oleraceus]
KKFKEMKKLLYKKTLRHSHFCITKPTPKNQTHLPSSTMSPSSNYISFLLFTTLLLPLQAIARDSEFFSKVTHFNKETLSPNKEESPTVTNKPEEQQPSFIPQTENSYGLYGHESDHLPTNTAATNSEFENNNKYYNNDAYNTKYYNKDPFGNNQNELSDTKYNGEGYNYNSMMEKQNNNERPLYNNNNYYNGEKQGMSDTRFLEGGKYFHDINNEKYNPTMYGDSYSKGVSTNNWYNNRGNSYNSNNNGNNNGYNNEYYQNNHGNYNGYKNQEVNQFEDEQNEFEP